MENSFDKLNIAAKTIAVTAALSFQVLPNVLYAQSDTKAAQTQNAASGITMKLKSSSNTANIVGIDNGNAVYKNNKGEFFTVDAKTGDFVFIDPETFASFQFYAKHLTANKANKPLVHIKFPQKEGSPVTILGVDKEGHTLQKNSLGEVFYVHPNTGDLVFVKF